MPSFRPDQITLKMKSYGVEPGELTLPSTACVTKGSSAEHTGVGHHCPLLYGAMLIREEL